MLCKVAAAILASVVQVTATTMSTSGERFPLLQTGVSTAFGGPTSVIALDTCRGVYWAVGSDKLWKLPVEGGQWSVVSLPDSLLRLSFSSVWMNGCQVVVQWVNVSPNNRHFVAVLSDSVWRNHESATDPMYAVNPMAELAGDYVLRMDYRELLHFSSNSGQTWDTMSVSHLFLSSPEKMQRVAADRIALLSTNSMPLEYGAGLPRPTQKTVPLGTKVYRYVSPSTIVASGESVGGRSWVSVSTDGGQLWVTADSIVIQPADTLRRGDGNGLSFRYMEAIDDSHLLGVALDGTILQLDVARLNWSSPARIPGIRSEQEKLFSFMAPDKTAWFMSSLDLYRLPFGRELEGPIRKPPYVSGFVAHGSKIISMGKGTYTSHDSGVTWALGAFEDSLYSSMGVGFGGLPQGSAERLALTGDTLFVAATTHGSVFSVVSGEVSLAYRGTIEERPFQCERGFLTTWGRMLSSFDGRRQFAKGSPPWMYSSVSKGVGPPIDDEGISWVGMLGDSTLAVVGDTMQMTSDEGSTWRAGGTGLPGIEFRSAAISNVIQTRRGTWIAALRGWSLEKSYILTEMPGGIYEPTLFRGTTS